MDGVAKRELTEVEMILGKGMLYDSSGLSVYEDIIGLLDKVDNYDI